MRKRSFAIGGVLVALAAFLIWWIGHKGGGGVHATEAPPAGSGSSAVRAPEPSAPAPAQLAGHVTDGAGNAIANAVVRLAPRRERDGGAPIAARTGADGAYLFDDVAPGRFVASAAANGFLAKDGGELSIAAGERRTLDFQLAPGGRPLAGTVTDATGGPVGGALVVAARERGALAAPAPDVAAAFTDDAGKYAMTVVEGAYRVSASHAEYVGATRRVEVGAAGATADFALVPGGAIEGQVEDAATGQGVVGARVDVAREALARGPGGAME